MNDIFQKGQLIMNYRSMQISTIKIYEEDMFDSDLSYYWRLISLSSVTRPIQQPIEPVVEKKEHVDEWKELEEKIEGMEIKADEQKSQQGIDDLMNEYKEITSNVNKELIRLSNLYRLETSNSKKQMLMNRIRLLKNYTKTGDPSLVIDYILEQRGIVDDKIRSELLTKIGKVATPKPIEVQASKDEVPEIYRNIIENMEKVPKASLLLYLIKNDPDTFRKYSLKQIDEQQAITRAKYYYLKQKGVPEEIIKRYLNDNYK